MTDVIVKIELEDPESEARLFEAVDHFATNKGTKALSEPLEEPAAKARATAGWSMAGRISR